MVSLFDNATRASVQPRWRLLPRRFLLNCGFSATLKPIPNDCRAISGRAESPDGSPQTTDLTAGLMVYAGAHAWDFRLTQNPCWCRELLGLDAAT